MPSDSTSKGVLRPRNILLGLVVMVLLAALHLATSEGAQRAAELRAAELAGDLANAAGGPRISTDESAISAWVVPTNEELMIALDTYEVVQARAG